MSKGKFLVTGGAGFIGSNIVEELVTRGYEVRVLDNFSTGKEENLKELSKDIEIVKGDIRDNDTVSRCMKNIDYVLHQAALPSVPRSIQDPITSNDVNVNGTLNILNAAKNANVKRVVYASSSSVYGDTPILPKEEEMTPNPISPYAVSKLAGEKYCISFSRVYGLSTVSLRYFNVFGPKQDPDSQYSAVIPKFVKAIINGKSPVIYGDGTQSRDFTFVKNVIEANILAATAECETPAVMNCATHSQITLNELVDLINKFTNRNQTAIYDQPRGGDIKHSYADISKAFRVIGYKPKVEFEEGLKATINFYSSL